MLRHQKSLRPKIHMEMQWWRVYLHARREISGMLCSFSLTLTSIAVQGAFAFGMTKRIEHNLHYAVYVVCKYVKSHQCHCCRRKSTLMANRYE
jgi:hypothetical protein